MTGGHDPMDVMPSNCPGLYRNNASGLSVHSTYMFECLLWTKHCSRHWGENGEQEPTLPSKSLESVISWLLIWDVFSLHTHKNSKYCHWDVYVYESIWQQENKTTGQNHTWCLEMLSVAHTTRCSANTVLLYNQPEKRLLLFYWLCQSLWLCGSQQTVENS